MDLGRKFVVVTLKQTLMSIISIIIALVLVGLVLWLINSFIPMDAKIKTILNVVVVILVVIWLLRASGLLSSVDSIRI